MGFFNAALRYTLIVSMGGFIFGFDASVISGVVGFVTSEFNLSTWQQGFVVSSPTLGAILSFLFVGPLCDAIGRRKVLIGIAALYCVSAITSALANSFELLVIARVIGGFAFCSLLVAPMYIAEISRPESRGKMVSINQLNIVLGLSVAYFANYFFLQISESGGAWVEYLMIDQHTWRWMLGIEALPAVVFMILLFSIPESPRWLLLKGRDEEANEVLQKLMPSEEIEEQVAQIKQSVGEKKMSLLVSLRMLFSPVLKLSLLIGLVVGIAQQVTGVNAIYFYAATIFEQSGVGTNAAFMQAIWIGLINIIFTLIAMTFIDKLGRKPLLVMGLAGVIISMSICAYGFKQATYELTPATVAKLSVNVEQQDLQAIIGVTYDNDLDYKEALIENLGQESYNANQAQLIQAAAKMNAVLIMVGILGFVASFAVSLGPVMWVLFSEIFPNQIRGVAISFVGAINSLASFGVQLVFPWELANLGAAMTFLVYGGFAVIGLVFVVFVMPETKGKSLEELEKQLGTN
ncbi:MAG: sugar porter (SP) family MFS transporter [Glaciecola sp.]|jgi:sugar porter (SP) family MFS transporter